jgi:hypothetical protein
MFCRTLLLVYSENDHYFISPNSNELLNTSNTTSREFGKKDHAIDVIVFEQLDVCSHFCDLEIK